MFSELNYRKYSVFFITHTGINNIGEVKWEDKQL